MKFGWTHEQYDSLTATERLLIMKQIELETVHEQTRLQSTIELAIGNAFRNKGKKYRKMYKKLKKKEDQPITNDEAKQLKKALVKLFKPKKNK